MIIFGTRGVRSTKATGSFNCPQCEADRPYKHKKVTQFFTLYFIPLIPLGNKGEYVECGHCKGTFITRVINSSKSKEQGDKEAFMAMYEQAIRHVMVKIMLADGVIDPNEKVMVLDIINKYGHNDMTSQQLNDYISKVQADKSDISTYLKHVGPKLNGHGKELLIKCALDVAYSDGHFDDSERALIFEMGKIMEMTTAHIKGIIAEVQEKMN